MKYAYCIYCIVYEVRTEMVGNRSLDAVVCIDVKTLKSIQILKYQNMLKYGAWQNVFDWTTQACAYIHTDSFLYCVFNLLIVTVRTKIRQKNRPFKKNILSLYVTRVSNLWRILIWIWNTGIWFSFSISHSFWKFVTLIHNANSITVFVPLFLSLSLHMQEVCVVNITSSFVKTWHLSM